MILFLDTYNLYHASMMQYEQVLDYDKVLKFINVGPAGITKYAYVAETDKSKPFADYLRSRGFIVHTKRIRDNKLDSFDVEIALHAIKASKSDSNLCFCTGSTNLLELFKILQMDSKYLFFYGVGVPHEFSRYGVTRELTEQLLRDYEEAAAH